MPDSLSLSTGVSLGLLAGIVSGVCYLVANGLTWPKSEQPRRRCLKVTQEDRGVCSECGGDQRGGLVPCICHDFKPVKFESGAWFLRQAQLAASLMPWSISTDKLEQIDEEYDGRESPGPSSRSAQNDATVREFLETLAAKLTGGALEGTRVSPLYTHPAYVRMLEVYQGPLRDALSSLGTALRDALTYLPPLRNGSPSSASSRPSSGASNAHVHLKRLVARVVEEAAALPALARYAAEPTTPTIESSTYEDLLASAILNKVIERFQNENGSGGRSSGIHSASASPTPSERSSPRSLASRNITHHSRDITPPLHEEDDVSDWEEGTDEALELPRRVPFPEFGGDIVHQNEEDEERELVDVSSSDLQGVDGTWEENWLFQKKKIKTLQSVPVPMLVPNSNADYRAMIGDRDADDTTDLSDNASDNEEQGEYKSDIKKVLDSKHVIGGKMKLDDESDYEPDSLTIVEEDEYGKLTDNGYKTDEAVEAIANNTNNSHITKTQNTTTDVVDGTNGNDSMLLMGIDDGPISKAEFNLKEEIHRTLMNGNGMHYLDQQDEEIYDDSIESLAINQESNNNTLNHHEREGEYEETVTIPVQRYADSLRRKHFDDTTHELQTEPDSTIFEDELVPGSVADRERKKWLNYVEMPNNPYSPEAIQKRLAAKSTSSLFDMITKKQDFDDENETQDIVNGNHSHEDDPKDQANKISGAVSTDNIDRDREPKSLKEVLADEVPQYKRYGRDYYIREAKSSAGGRKKQCFSDTSSLSSMNKSTSLDNFDTELASPYYLQQFNYKTLVGILIKQFNVIATNQQYNNFAKNGHLESITITPDNKTEILIEYEDHSDQTLYEARPVIVDDDIDEKFDEILQSAYNSEIATNDTEHDKNEEPIKSPISVANSFLSSSSLEDSIKIYNIQTGEIIKCRPEDNILSARYDTAADSGKNIDLQDKSILGDDFDSASQNEDLDDEAVIIEEHKNLEIEELEDLLPQLPKVKDLAKKFVSMENISEPSPVPQAYSKRRRSKENVLDHPDKQPNKQMYMHSLTARSITKEFREGLKLSMSTPIKVPGGSKEVPEGDVTRESSRPGSPVPEPGTIKTKLAFFESLKTKFSSK